MLIVSLRYFLIFVFFSDNCNSRWYAGGRPSDPAAVHVPGRRLPPLRQDRECPQNRGGPAGSHSYNICTIFFLLNTVFLELNYFFLLWDRIFMNAA